MNADLKRITILHSNDIHGQFTGEIGEDGKLRGSMAQVAGLVAQTKKDNPNTLYCIAGDVFQGSLIDSDYQGLSTIDILNLIDIDVMSLGNHELDYGISHMLRPEVLEDWQETFFHFSKRLKIDFDFDSKELSVEFDGLPLEDDRILEVGMQEYYLVNSETGFGIRPEELVAEEEGIWIASPNAFLTLQDYMSEHKKLGKRIDDRCVIKGNVGGLALEVKSGKRKKGLLGEQMR